MKSFVVFLALLFCILIAIDRGLGLVMDQLFHRVMTGQRGGKINHYLLQPPPPLVIMGSSRAVHNVNPDSFRVKAFNLGHGGMHTSFQTGLLRLMEENKKLPPVILLQIDPNEFTGALKVRDIQQLSYYYHQSDTLRLYINELSVFEQYKYYFDLSRYNGKVIGVVKESILPGRSSDPETGYQRLPASDRDSVNVLTLADRPIESSVTINANQFRYLESFIEICRRNNIRLICFTSPSFKALDAFNVGSAEVSQFLARRGVAYLNYTDTKCMISVLQRHPSYWKDVTHLNQTGAEIFSGILATQVELLLRGTP